MTPYSASTCERLASELEAADKEMTPAPWTPNVWIETDGNEWRATGPGHDCESPYDYSQPGGPDEQAAQRDARGLCNLRNSAPEVAAALRAAVAEVERLTKERDEARNRVLRPLSLAEVKAALHEGRAEAMAATGDNAWSSLLNQRDFLRTRLAALEAMVDKTCSLLERNRAPGDEDLYRELLAIRAAKEAK